MIRPGAVLFALVSVLPLTGCWEILLYHGTSCYVDSPAVTACFVANSAGEDFTVVVPKGLQTLMVDRPADKGELHLDLNGVIDISIVGNYYGVTIEHQYPSDPDQTHPNYGVYSDYLQTIEITHEVRTGIGLVIDMKPPLTEIRLNSDAITLDIDVNENLETIALIELRETASLRFLQVGVGIEVYPPSEATIATLHEWAARSTTGSPVELRVETNGGVSIEDWREHFDTNIFELSERRIQ